MRKRETELNQKMAEKDGILKELNLQFDKNRNEILMIKSRTNQLNQFNQMKSTVSAHLCLLTIPVGY